MTGIPAAWHLRPDPGLRRTGEGGRVLIGGSPLRVMRLSEAGAKVLDGWAAGNAVGSSPARQKLARRLVDGGLAHPRPAGVPATSAADVTVVIPVHGDGAALARTLACLDGVRTVVVDDGSPAPIPRVSNTDLLWLRRPVNGGPGAARQTGLAAVRTPLVAFVDAGVEPPPGWLDTLVAHFDDPTVVAVAPRVVSAPGDGSIRDRYEQMHSPLDLGGAEARVAPRTQVAYVPTAALVARLDAIEAVGGFDPDLRFGEDVDLVWRLVEAGGTVRYAPSVRVQHRPRTTWSAWVNQRRGYGSAAAPLVRRHPGQVPPVAVSAWSAAAWSIAVAGHPMLGVGVAAGSAALLPRKLGSVVPDPWGETLRLAGRGHLHAGRWLARAVTRTWWPLALVAALFSRRARLALGAAMLVPLLDWKPQLGIGRARYVATRLADDIAYGAGVWEGCLRERSASALKPDLTSWPGRRSGAVES